MNHFLKMDKATWEALDYRAKRNLLYNATDPEDTMKQYKLWADTYDKEMYDRGRDARTLPAYRLILQYFHKTDVRILDAGAGTGLVGQGLKMLGYTNLDALDGSQEMLDVAKEKRIYQNTICCLLGRKYKTSILKDTYDCVVCAGCFVPGSMKEDAFPEMIRVTKPGGLIIIIMSLSYLTENNYLDNLEPTMLDYSKKGYLTWVLRQHEEQYMAGEKGISYVFRKNNNVK